jgi:hypothetical protein
MIPTLFTSGVLIAPSGSLVSSGYVAGNTLGAQHFNWYLYHLTAELNNLLAGVGISQLTTDDQQIMKAVGRAQIAITATGTTTAAAFTGDTWVKYNNAGAATYDISAGASRAGVMLFIEETNANGVTIQTGSGTAFLGIGAVTLLWDGTQWVQTGGNAVIQILTTGSPYTIPAVINQIIIINATTNPFIANLPAATGSGKRVKIINGSLLATGLVKITPNGTDQIGSAGNVSIYLQNVDQSGAPYFFQSIELVDDRAGYWAVVDGQFQPHQTVDTDGQQYHLGKLHHVPLGNTTSRALLNSSQMVAGWNGPYTATGVFGIPNGAKAVRLRIRVVTGNASGGSSTWATLAWSDNNSNTPTFLTAHPMIDIGFVYATAVAVNGTSAILDVPLNASGQFYIYGWNFNNLASGYPSVTVCPIGYYMGD